MGHVTNCGRGTREGMHCREGRGTENNGYANMMRVEVTRAKKSFLFLASSP